MRLGADLACIGCFETLKRGQFAADGEVTVRPLRSGDGFDEEAVSSVESFQKRVGSVFESGRLLSLGGGVA